MTKLMKKPFVRMCMNCQYGKSYIEGTQYGRRCKQSNDRKVGDTTIIPDWCPGWREKEPLKNTKVTFLRMDKGE